MDLLFQRLVIIVSINICTYAKANSVVSITVHLAPAQRMESLLLYTNFFLYSTE